MKQVLRKKDKGNFIVRYLRSFGHAVSGILYACFNEHNLIIIIAAMIVTTMAGIHFKINAFEWLFCIGIMGAVAATELINTAIEATVDLISIKSHPLAKIAKDTASGATLLLCITALIGACIIFIPKF